jgi:glycine betaine catabolism A
VVVEAAGESVLLVRTRAGELAAHYNVCRHRGSQVVPCPPAEPGQPQATPVRKAGSLRCPYHSWTYRLEGDLLRAPWSEEIDGFDQAAFGLHPVGVATWGGFVFLHLTPAEAVPLADQLGCAGVHPELCRVVPAFKRGGSGLDWDRGIPHREGAWTFTASGQSDRAPFPGLDDDERTRHKGELVYPNLMLSLSADHVAAFTLWPRGPGETTVVCELLFHPDERARPGFDPSDAADFWDLVNRQDWAMCESVQRGMASRAYSGGWFAPMEQPSLDIRRYVVERVGGSGGSSSEAPEGSGEPRRGAPVNQAPGSVEEEP